MKAAAQPFPSDCQPYQPWPVVVYQSSSFWSLMQWRLLKNNPIFLVHTRCKEAQKLPSSSHSLSPVTTHLFSYTWKSYTHSMGHLKLPLISQCWCHTPILQFFLRVFHNSVCTWSAQQLFMLQPQGNLGKEDSEHSQHVFIHTHIYMC